MQEQQWTRVGRRPSPSAPPPPAPAVRRLLLLAALAALAALTTAAPDARADTIRLDWRESDGVGVMSFRVRTLTVARGAWAVAASFTNRSQVPLRVEPRHRNGFSLRAYSTRGYASPHVALHAAWFRPRLPATLAPGRSWRGTFGGTGRVPRLTWVRVLFGRFDGRPSPIPEYPSGFSWLTAHAYRVR